MQASFICCRCQVPLEHARAEFSYMGHTFHTDLPKCPKCGQIFISEDMAKGKMAEVETELEDK